MFIDYERAYGTVYREILWMIVESYGNPLKLVEMVKATPDGNQCLVPYNTGLTGWFDVKSGVK